MTTNNYRPRFSDDTTFICLESSREMRIARRRLARHRLNLLIRHNPHKAINRECGAEWRYSVSRDGVHIFYHDRHPMTARAERVEIAWKNAPEIPAPVADDISETIEAIAGPAVFTAIAPSPAPVQTPATDAPARNRWELMVEEIEMEPGVVTASNEASERFAGLDLDDSSAVVESETIASDRFAGLELE